MPDTGHIGERLRSQRLHRGLTQAEVAERASVSRTSVFNAERGKPGIELGIILAIARAVAAEVSVGAARPSRALQAHREEVLAEARRLGLRNLRVFGSTARGDDTETSDIDLIADPPSEMHLGVFYGFADYIERITGFPVDLVSGRLDGPAERAIKQTAVPL